MGNKQIKRLFPIAISALKKIKQDNEKNRVQGDGGRGVNYELARKVLSEEATLEVRPK